MFLTWYRNFRRRETPYAYKFTFFIQQSLLSIVSWDLCIYSHYFQISIWVNECTGVPYPPPLSPQMTNYHRIPATYLGIQFNNKFICSEKSIVLSTPSGSLAGMAGPQGSPNRRVCLGFFSLRAPVTRSPPGPAPSLRLSCTLHTAALRL